MPDRTSARPLRVAAFSGNYNYVKDGANQALNLLVARMEERGLLVRIYSPVVKHPAFEPQGTLIGVPSVPIPGRMEYRLALGLPRAARRDLEAFRPDLIHLAAPDWLGHKAKRWGKEHGVPVVASVHTRFETYFDYYGLGFARRGIERLLRNFYGDLAEIYAPTEGVAELLRHEGFSNRVRIWSRGVDRAVFRPEARDLEWRRRLGIPADAVVVGFVGRLVLEKGLKVVAATMAELSRRGVPHHLLVVGDGPARAEFERLVPEARFTGFLTGAELGRAFASCDMFLNPSTTETFGNVTLEAMACAVPPIGARALGSSSLIVDHETGRLVPPDDAPAFADALQAYIEDEALRLAHGAASYRRSLGYEWTSINDRVIDRYFAIADPGGERAA